jgi:drug/metabolite transporter (DMT)-like permease
VTSASHSVAASHPGLRGILLMMSAVLIFACMDTTAKFLSASYTMPQIVWARYFFQTLFILVAFLPRTGARIMHTRRLPLQVVRALTLVLCTAFFFAALRYMPLSSATSIGFIAPLLVTAFSGPLLGERVKTAQWFAVAAGFSGVLIVIRPGGGLLSVTALLPMASSLCYAFYQILTRKLAGSENPVTTLFYTAVVGAAVSIPPLPFYWVAPTLAHWGLMLLIGTGGGIGHYILIKAFERTPASVLAPFGYTQMIWIILLGYAVFGYFPDAVSLLGMAVIVASGLYCGWAARSRATADTAAVIGE